MCKLSDDYFFELKNTQYNGKFKENGKLKLLIIVGTRPVISQLSRDKSQQC